MKTINSILEKFDERTNYKNGVENTLLTTTPDWNGEKELMLYPESPYEIDKDKIKSFLTQALNSVIDEMMLSIDETIENPTVYGEGWNDAIHAFANRAKHIRGEKIGLGRGE